MYKMNEKEKIVKLVIVNVPFGTTKDDVQNLILQWTPDVNVLVVDLVMPFYRSFTTVYAFVYLTIADCKSVIDYYNRNFKKKNGFLFRNKFGFDSIVTVRMYVEKTENRGRTQPVECAPGSTLSDNVLPYETVKELNLLVEEKKIVTKEKGQLHQQIDRLKLILKFREELKKMETESRKILMCNLPDGTMKSDVTEILNGWVDSIEIISVDIVPTNRNKSPITDRKTLTAYVQLPSKKECDVIVQFYNEKFGKDEGFAYQNNFGYYEMVKVKHYTRKIKKENLNVPFSKQEVEEDWGLDDNDAIDQIKIDQIKIDQIKIDQTKIDQIKSSEVPKFTVLLSEDQLSSDSPCLSPFSNGTTNKIIIHGLPNDVTKEEVSHLIRTWKPDVSVVKSIDIAPPAGKRDRLNAYISLEKVDCDSIVDFHAEKFSDGFWFISEAGTARSLKVTHYQGKRRDNNNNNNVVKRKSNIDDNSKLQLIINCLPTGTQKAEIVNLIRSWNPDLVGFQVHIQASKSRAFIKRLSKQAMNSLHQNYVENFKSVGGYSFINNIGVFGMLRVELRNQSLPNGFQSDKPEIDIVAEISKGWADKSDEDSGSCIENPFSIDYLMTCNKDDINQQESSLISYNIGMENEGNRSNTKDLTFIASQSQSDHRMNLKQLEESVIPSPSHDEKKLSGFELKKDGIGHVLADDEIVIINELLKEKESWTRSKIKKERYNELLEKTLEEKDEDFFVSETQLASLRSEVEEFEKKLEKLNALKIKNLQELEELKENLTLLK